MLGIDESELVFRVDYYPNSGSSAPSEFAYGRERTRHCFVYHGSDAGWSDADIDQVLRIETPNNAFFNEKGIYNYHGGANVVFDDPDNLNWVISHSKG